MSEELSLPNGMTWSPVESADHGTGAQQTAWDFEAGGSYSGQVHSDNGHTAAEVSGEAHVNGDAWGHDFHGDVEGGMSGSYDPHGVHATEHLGGHADVHSHDAFAHSHPVDSGHATHSHDSGGHGSHHGDHGSHGGDHGSHGGSHDGAL